MKEFLTMFSFTPLFSMVGEVKRIYKDEKQRRIDEEKRLRKEAVALLSPAQRKLLKLDDEGNAAK